MELTRSGYESWYLLSLQHICYLCLVYNFCLFEAKLGLGGGGLRMTGQDLVETGGHALLVEFVVSVEVADPESCYFCHLFMVEDAYAMRRSE